MNGKYPPQLLPGPSALEENELNLRARAAGLAVVALMVGGTIVLENPARSLVLLGLLAPGFLLIAGIYRSSRAERAAAMREREAGYTTEFDIAGKDLWQLDPKTGIVLRRPGEPLISRRDAQRLKRQA